MKLLINSFALVFALFGVQKTALADGRFIASEIETNCLEHVQADAKYAPLGDTIRSDASNFVRYSNQSKINDKDHELIPQYITELEECRNQYSDARYRQHDQVLESISDDMFNVYVGLTAKLYNGEMTYGEFNKANDKEFSEHMLKIRQREAEIHRGIAAAQSRANAESDAAYNAQMRQGLQQMFRSLNPAPPIQTNCVSRYGYTNCTSR